MTSNEPTLADLAAIADEWPVIAAEVAVVAAECRLASSPDALSVRAHRRAVAALNTVTRREVAARVAVVKVRRVVDVPARCLTVASAPVAA